MRGPRRNILNRRIAQMQAFVKVRALPSALVVAMDGVHYYRTLTVAERLRKHVLMAATIVGFSPIITAMSVAIALNAWSPRFGAACLLATLMLLVLLLAFEHPVPSMADRLRDNVLIKSVEAYMELAQAAYKRLAWSYRAVDFLLVLMRGIAAKACSAEREMANITRALISRLHVVHVCVLPAHVQSALVAPRYQPGAGT